MGIEVRSARRSDVPALARVLGRAFQNDPVMMWMQPDATRRGAALAGFFGAVTRHHYLAGGGVEVAESESGVGAAALWDPPGRWAVSSREQLAMLPAVIRAFRGRLGEGRALTEQMKAVHPEEPHWYLGIIGSDPEARGGGFGHALMRSRLDRCDAEGAPAYLESSNRDNIAYYNRFGFDVTGEIVIPDGPSLWPMWRAARLPR
ncbi:GNAT family N-acetyltransferase [Mycolicibacterium sp.]|uniref:GNAT family N-acetyltransferase n=1 Tax=Mycolicibacterium sp. TaxID=2320850 RepID=UPI0025CD813A|nr:GNAT family N-acetyltransferase [Mycolicibacterium sp.]